MTRGKAEDAGGLTPAKDDNAAPYHFDRRTLSIFKCVDYKNLYSQPLNAVWPVFFPPYCVAFPCNPSGLLRKISLSDEKNPRPSSIPRL